MAEEILNQEETTQTEAQSNESKQAAKELSLTQDELNAMLSKEKGSAEKAILKQLGITRINRYHASGFLWGFVSVIRER